MTYQNTLPKEDKGKKETRQPVTLASIFPTLKASHSNESTIRTRSLLKYDSKINKKNSTTELESLNPSCLNDAEQIKTGRFTICAVEKSDSRTETKHFNRVHCTSLVTMNCNERLFPSIKCNEKRSNQLSRQVLFQMHRKKQAALHFRTNSLPPFNLNSQSSFVNNCDDEGYLTSNKNNSNVDLD